MLTDFAHDELHERPAAGRPAGPVGLDLAAAQRFLGPAAAGPLAAELLSGGRSNLTYLVTDGRSRWALRHPPPGLLTPSAHDVALEYRLVHALHGRIPVARTVALCKHPAVIAVPFAIVEYADGLTLRTPADLVPYSPWESRRCHAWSRSASECSAERRRRSCKLPEQDMPPPACWRATS